MKVFCKTIGLRCAYYLRNTKEVTDGLPTDLSAPLATLAARSPQFAAGLDGGKPSFLLFSDALTYPSLWTFLGSSYISVHHANHGAPLFDQVGAIAQ